VGSKGNRTHVSASHPPQDTYSAALSATGIGLAALRRAGSPAAYQAALELAAARLALGSAGAARDAGYQELAVARVQVVGAWHRSEKGPRACNRGEGYYIMANGGRCVQLCVCVCVKCLPHPLTAPTSLACAHIPRLSPFALHLGWLSHILRDASGSFFCSKLCWSAGECGECTLVPACLHSSLPLDDSDRRPCRVALCALQRAAMSSLGCKWKDISQTALQHLAIGSGLSIGFLLNCSCCCPSPC
jgi:hypothetical protein